MYLSSILYINNFKTTSMILKTNILARIKKDQALVRALEDFHVKKPFTMQTWLRENNPMLCNINSLKIIAAYLETDIDSILEKTEADFPNVV